MARTWGAGGRPAWELADSRDQEQLQDIVAGAVRREFADLRRSVREDVRKEVSKALSSVAPRPSLRRLSLRSVGAESAGTPRPPNLCHSDDDADGVFTPSGAGPTAGVGLPGALGPEAEFKMPAIRRLSRVHSTHLCRGPTEVSAIGSDTVFTPPDRLRGHMRALRHRLSSMASSLGLASRDVEVPDQSFGERVVGFVRSLQFDYLSGACVILNALFVGLQTDWQARNLTLDSPPFFRAVEIMFCAIFSVELALRVASYRRDFLATPHIRWHIFDCILVGSQLIEEIMLGSVQLGAKSSGANMTSNFSALRVLRVLRLIRVMRLVRVLRLIAELRTLVMSIMGSLKSLVWAVCLLFMMMYAMGIYITQLVLDYRVDQVRDDEALEPLVKFYGSLGDTVLSVYGAVTGGVDWGDILDPLRSHISVFLVPFFMLYIAFATLCMLNVITGVFVESALLTAKEDKDTYMVNSARLLFETFDANRSGKMSRREFSQAVRSLEMRRVLSQLDIDVSEADVLFDLLDTQNLGRISAEEFREDGQAAPRARGKCA